MISERNTIVKIDCRTDGRGSISIVAESKIDKIIAEIFDKGKSIQSVELIEATGIDTLWFAIREPKLWSPSSPFLYDVTLKLFSGDDIEVIHEKFGVRTISTNQDNILLNDKPFYVRGYIRGIKAHDHADTCNLGEEEYYRKNILQAKKYGFNFIRFHSTIPTKTFFKVADELGILVHIEFREDIDEYNNLEEMVHDTEKLISPTYVKGIIEDLYNHPSLAVYCIGNEIKGNKVSDTIQQIRKKIKENDTSRPFLDSCAWGMNGRKWVDIDVQHMSYYFPFAKHADMYENTENLLVAGDADGNALLEEGINSSIARELFFNVPLLAHEVCHYTALRDYKTLNEKYEKYGTQKPWWVEESLKMIEAKGLADIYDEMYRASKLFQHECWKIAFEAMRRSKLLGGFHFLQFTDTDAYENSNGMVDCFDDECFISPKQVLDFNGDRVLLADVGSRIAYSGDELHIPVMLSNYAETNDKKATFNYSLVDGEGEVFASGEMKNLNISKNGLYRICAITVKLPEISSRKLMLKVKLTSDLGVVTANEWSIWVYRKEISVNYNTFCNYERGNVVVTDDIEKALVKLDEGKNVCLVYRQDYTRHIIHQDMDAPKYSLKATWNRFKPVIWDRGTNYGGLCNDKLLNKYGFATDRVYSVNYSALTEDCDKIILDTFPVKVKSIIDGIDKSVRDRFDAYVKCFNMPDFLYDRTLRNFSYLFEVKVGNGNLLLCGLNMTGLDKDEPSTMSMAQFIINYMSSSDFAPDNYISKPDFENYLIECAKEPVKERVMSQFWQLDDTPVESSAFWDESREYIDDGTWGKNPVPKY